MTLLETGESTTTLGHCRFSGLFFLPYSLVIGRTYHPVSAAVYDILRDDREILKFFYIIMTSAYSTRDGSRTDDAFLLGPVSARCLQCDPWSAANGQRACIRLYERVCVWRVRVILMNDSRFVVLYVR